MDLKGKVAIVTGSSSGIGEAIAIKLASIGVNVVITGRDDSRIANVVKECGNRAIGVKADLESESDIKSIVQKTVQKFGKIDILVNNAAIWATTSLDDPVDKFIATFDKLMNTNVRAIQVLTQLVLPYLEKTKGNIINISSVSSLKPTAPTMHYCMSKSALDVFTVCMAAALGPRGIRVNSINPGATKTPVMTTPGYEKMLEFIEQHSAKGCPLGRMAEPKEIAEVVAFVASDKASYMTGAIIPVDGGVVLGPGVYINYDNFHA